jgi:hypothetical protein
MIVLIYRERGLAAPVPSSLSPFHLYTALSAAPDERGDFRGTPAGCCRPVECRGMKTITRPFRDGTPPVRAAGVRKGDRPKTAPKVMKR